MHNADIIVCVVKARKMKCEWVFFEGDVYLMFPQRPSLQIS